MLGKSLACLILVICSALAVCPSGTVFDARFNKCYKYIAQATNFLLAEKNCESIGGSLVTVSNAFENTFISGIAAYTESTTQFWIGMDLLYSSGWSWINSDSSTFRSWAAGEPSSSRPCGAIRIADNQWITVMCNYEMPYMCQIDPNAAPINGCTTPAPVQPVTTDRATTLSKPLTTALPGSCPKGYCLDNDYDLNPDTCNCFKVFGYGQNYSTAVDVCSNNNATLPIILNESDNYFIGKYETWSGNWLALYCAGTLLSSCSWQDGSSLGYTDFAAGYPVAGQVYLGYGAWFTVYEGATATVVCQKKGISTPIPIPDPTPCSNGHCPDSSYTLNAATCKCYKYYQNTLMTYSEARGYCSGQNATLSIILNQADNQFIFDFTLSSGANDPWIGAYCRTTAINSCRWENGSPLGYENLAGGPQAGQYAYIRYGKWYTSPGYSNQGCLCQQMGIP